MEFLSEGRESGRSGQFAAYGAILSSLLLEVGIAVRLAVFALVVIEHFLAHRTAEVVGVEGGSQSLYYLPLWNHVCETAEITKRS